MPVFTFGDLFTTDEVKRTDYDLPDAEVVLFENFFSLEESNTLFANLLESINWKQDQIKMYGKSLDVPRLSAWYGDKGYSYSGIDMEPNPWIDDLLLIKNRVEAQANIEFNSCLLNLYQDGSHGVGWHQDNEKELGQNPVIGSVTFGETRPFQLKHIKRKDLKKTDVQLPHGSFLLMEGATQHHWKHQIPKTKRKIRQRINLTFRVIS